MGNEAFPAGEYLRDELAERGWTVDQFAEMTNVPTRAVREVLDNKRRISTYMARAFAATLGTTPELWLNLQAMSGANDE